MLLMSKILKFFSKAEKAFKSFNFTNDVVFEITWFYVADLRVKTKFKCTLRKRIVKHVIHSETLKVQPHYDPSEAQTKAILYLQSLIRGRATQSKVTSYNILMYEIQVRYMDKDRQWQKLMNT